MVLFLSMSQYALAVPCGSKERLLLEGRLTWTGNSPNEILVLQVNKKDYKIIGPLYQALLQRVKTNSGQKIKLVGVVSGAHIGPGFPQEFSPIRVENKKNHVNALNCNKG